MSYTNQALSCSKADAIMVSVLPYIICNDLPFSGLSLVGISHRGQGLASCRNCIFFSPKPYYHYGILPLRPTVNFGISADAEPRWQLEVIVLEIVRKGVL